MRKNAKRFRTVRFRFETDTGTDWERYMITDNYIPCFRVNQWLELKSIRKASTGLECAKKMTVFLNWLDSNGVSFEDATNRNIRQFLHFLIFGNMQDGKMLSLQSTARVRRLQNTSRSSPASIGGWIKLSRLQDYRVQYLPSRISAKY